jgi:hypothetical protein
MYCVENKKNLFKLPIVQHMQDTRFIHQLCKMHIVFTVWIWHQHQQLLIRIFLHISCRSIWWLLKEKKYIYIYIYMYIKCNSLCIRLFQWTDTLSCNIWNQTVMGRTKLPGWVRGCWNYITILDIKYMKWEQVLFWNSYSYIMCKLHFSWANLAWRRVVI